MGLHSSSHLFTSNTVRILVHVTPKCDTEPACICYMTLHFQGQRSLAPFQKADGLCRSSGIKRNATRHRLVHLSPQSMATQVTQGMNISKIPFLTHTDTRMTTKNIISNLTRHVWQTKLRTTTMMNKWAFNSDLKIIQKWNNFPPLNYTSHSWNKNTATEAKLKKASYDERKTTWVYKIKGTNFKNYTILDNNRKFKVHFSNWN